MTEHLENLKSEIDNKLKSPEEQDQESLVKIEQFVKSTRAHGNLRDNFEIDTGIKIDDIEMDMKSYPREFKVNPEALKQILTNLKNKYKENLESKDYILRTRHLKHNLELYDRYRIGSPPEILDAMLKDYSRTSESDRRVFEESISILYYLKKYNYFPIDDAHLDYLRQVARDYIDVLLKKAARGPHGQDHTDYSWLGHEKEYSKSMIQEATNKFEFFVKKGILSEEKDEDLYDKVTSDK
ncbi:hypothetical protein HYT01_01430 [Candidatus Giovannonibacteria bacterium]|nr:hypothetical protein [Candidatus Giovannonibacteria bacterium]